MNARARWSRHQARWIGGFNADSYAPKIVGKVALGRKLCQFPCRAFPLKPVFLEGIFLQRLLLALLEKRVWALSWALLTPLRPRFIDFSTVVKWLIGLSGFKRSALHGNWHNFRPRATFPTIFGAYELALNPPTQRAWCRDHRARAFTRILKVA